MFAPVMSSSSRVEEPQRQQNSFSYFDKRGVFFLKDIFVRSLLGAKIFPSKNGV